jgi:uncharacterized Ntn-hydrolase superfamily protein
VVVTSFAVTFSLCVRETVEADEASYRRFGVAVTTRRPGVGARCPFVDDHGVVATQSASCPALGRRCLAYLSDGLAIDDALEALLNADEERDRRQVHGLDANGTFAFTGADCRPWHGHRTAGDYTVAGNLLTGEEVIEATAAAYEAGDRSDPLPERLIESLAAGHEAGGDRRDRSIQSAACRVRTTRDGPRPFAHDLRVDATERPIEELRRTCELARAGWRPD